LATPQLPAFYPPSASNQKVLTEWQISVKKISLIFVPVSLYASATPSSTFSTCFFFDVTALNLGRSSTLISNPSTFHSVTSRLLCRCKVYCLFISIYYCPAYIFRRTRQSPSTLPYLAQHRSNLTSWFVTLGALEMSQTQLIYVVLVLYFFGSKWQHVSAFN